MHLEANQCPIVGETLEPLAVVELICDDETEDAVTPYLLRL